MYMGWVYNKAHTLLKFFKKEKYSDMALNSGSLVSPFKVTRDPKRLKKIKQIGFQDE
jgi:hypothetical protein